MTNHPKPANDPNATQILNKFILKHLCPKKVQRPKKSIGLLLQVLIRSTFLMRPNKKYELLLRLLLCTMQHALALAVFSLQ